MAEPKLKPMFPTSSDSPFEDGYDIAGERDALKDLVEAENPDEKDPRWERFMDLLEREERLRQEQSNRQQRQYADPIVPDHEARALKAIGSLVAEESDVMAIHTREAYRLFIGRTRDESTRGYGITSGKKVAAVLRSIWNLSANDNPYADWILVQVSDRVGELRQQLEQTGKQFQEDLDRLQTRGLRVSVLKSRAPVEVELGFRSPYGYMIVDLILDFDWYARVIKTMVLKNRVGDLEGKEDLYLMTPQAIFTGEVRPRHSRRRADVSEAEMRLLMEVAQGKVDVGGSDLKQEDTLL
ncbi:MAG: integrating conjugative element protein [Hydrogenophilales bacterium 17-61-9]|nr:MAG: integrating conjugative element protein [Hydrogenophilales bacterium 17-61-9]